MTDQKLIEALRMVADYIMTGKPLVPQRYEQGCGEFFGVQDWMRREANRLEAAAEQRDRDMQIGRAVMELLTGNKAGIYIEMPSQSLDVSAWMSLGKAAREAVEAEK